MELCSRIVSLLHEIILSWSYNLYAIRSSKIFILLKRLFYIVNRVIFNKLRFDWKGRKVIEIYAKNYIRSLIEKWKIITSVVK